MRAQTGYDPVKPHDEWQHRHQISPGEERKRKGTDEWKKQKRCKRHQACREDRNRAPSWNLKHSYSLSVLHRIGEHVFRMPVLEVMERVEQRRKPRTFWGYILD